MQSKPSKTVGFLLYDNFTALDLFGPLEAFYSAADRGGCEYKILLLGAEQKEYRAEPGARVIADCNLKNAPVLDTLVVPGGSGSRALQTASTLCPWLAENAHHIRRVVSVCTGAFLLAEAGLLDRKKATTHWQHKQAFEARFPNVHLNTEALYIQGEHISTSAGISSGIDLALKLIEDDCGAEVATQVARILVVHYRRAGDQAQFSEPLKFQQRANSAFASLTGWIMNHLSDELNTTKLAEQAGMSERNFYRKFKQQMGQSPGTYVTQLRLDYARQLLTEKDWPNKRIAQASGYPQVDVFRRAFEKRFGVSPKQYKTSFSKN